MNCKENCERTTYMLKRIQMKMLLIIANFHNNGLSVITIQDLKQKLEFTERKLYYNLNKLIEKEFVNNEGNSVLNVKLSEKGKAYIEDVVGNLQIDASYVNTFLDRAHRITIMQPIIQRGTKPARFEERDTSKLNWKENIFSLHEKGYSIEIKPNAIYYHFHQLFGLDPHSITFRALGFCFRFAQTLKDDGWKLDLPKTVTIEQEHAIFNEAMAKFTQKYNIKYKSDRLTYDGSIKENEFELTHSEHAPEDFVRVTDFFEAVIREKFNINNLIDLVKLKPQIDLLLQNYRQNIQEADKIVNDK